MNRKNVLLFALIFLGSYLTTEAQSYCEPNLDFETGTTSYWNYWRGKNMGTSWAMLSCLPAPTLHTITSGLSGTDPYGGFSLVGDGLYSLKLSKDTTNQNADGADYHVHVPTGAGTAYSLIYRYAIVFQNPGHSPSQQPRFEVSVTDSATGGTIPCNSYTFVSSGSLPGFTLSSVGYQVWYKPWTAGSLNLTGMGGKTVIVKFLVGGCTPTGHWGYCYVDMNCGIFKIQTVGCSGGSATLTAPPGYSSYTWTDSLSFTKSYGTTQTVTITVPTVTTTYAVILSPYYGYGCTDTLYARLVPSNMITHQAHDTAICYGATVKIWGGATDILPLTYSWTPTTGLSCTTCDTTYATPPVGLNPYKITTYNTGGCLQTDTINVRVWPIPAAISGNKNVCLGLTTGLSDIVTGGGWTTSNTSIAGIGSATGIVTGNAVGTANITYSFGGLCPVYTTVTVNPLPGPITGTPVLCVGFTTSLTDGPGAGTWSSSTTTIAAVGSTGTVLGMSGGTAIITWTLTSSTCWSTKAVTVMPVPVAITGLTTVCQGSTTTLVDGSPGGVWSSSNTSVATIGTGGVVTGISPGTAGITYTIGTGCYVNTVMTVLLTPVPITGVPIMCQGFTSALSDATPGGYWSTSDPTVATVGSTTGLVFGVGPVTAVISYTLPGPFSCNARMTVTVNPIPGPIAGTLNVCVGQTTALSDALSGGTWTSSNPAIGTVVLTTGVVTGVSPGTFICTYAITGTGCLVTTTITVNANPSAIIGSKSLCVGGTTSLTDAIGGGTWSSLTGSVAGFLGGPSSGIATGIASGTETISYILGTGCYATATLTVNSVPAITGAFKMCIGATSTLSDAVTGGTWTSGTLGIATVGSATGIVTGVAAGTSIITYTSPFGCPAYATVTISPLPSAITGPTTVCIGATTTLSDGTTGGVWTSGTSSIATIVGVGGSGVVTGHLAGSATITYSVFSTGCYITTSVLVSPAPGPIGGKLTVCVGATTTLSDAIMGGSWTSTATTVSVGLLTGDITGVTPGTASITYSLGGSCKVTATVSVIAPPSGITGTATVCVGATTLLSDASPAGTWSSSVPANATISGGGLVSGLVAGTTTISYILTSTGCFATKDVTVNPLPAAITGTKTVCVGLTTSLSDFSAGGTWSSSSGVITIGTSTGVVFGGAVGTATMTYKLTTTGCATTTVVTVNPLPAAIGGPSAVCVNSNITLSDATLGGVWTSGSTTIISITGGGTVTGLLAGTATVTYTLGTGCLITGVITVNPLPAPITGPTAVCIGKTITLSDATTGGGWTSTFPAIATIDPVSGLLTGGTTLGCTPIIYTLPTGCQKTTTVCVSPSPTAILGPSSLCVGTCVTLSDPVTGGNWSNLPATIGTIDATTGTYCGLMAGTSTVTYSLGSGCTVTTIMKVNPLPSVITGAGAICSGNTLTLSDGTPGGIWTSSNTLIATVGSLSGIVSGISGVSGTATITYSLGCIVTTTVTVNLTPTPLTGPGTVCQLQTITLNDAITGGIWTSSSPGVASVVSSGPGLGDVTGNSGGTAIITYALGSCNTTKTVTVYPVATLGGSATLCTGHTTTLTSTLPGTWTSGSPAIAAIGLTTGVVTGGATAGTAVITFTPSSGCTSTIVVNVSSTPGPITGVFQVCKGQTAALTDAGGGAWSCTPLITATIDPVTGVYTGVNAGTAMVTYSLGSGCSVYAPVTVNPLPAAISGSSNLCALSTVTLTTTSTGGTWSTTSGLVTVGSGTGIVKAGAIPGTATITYTIAATGCNTTKVITINPLPAAIGGTPSMCVGQTTVLTNTGTGTWSSSIPAVATIGATSGIATGITAGTTPIIFTETATGCKTSVTATVVPLPSPISAPAAVCVGQITTLTDLVKGGNWTSANTVIATIDPVTGDLTGISSGTVIISYSVASGCSIFTTIIINPVSPIMGSNTVCVGQATTMLDTTLGGVWSGTSAKVYVGPGTGIVTGLAAGSATITYTTPKGCVATHVVTVNAVPLPITGSDNICLGQTKTYTDLTAGGVWSSSDPATADFTSPGIVMGYTLGTATLSYTISGCAAVKTVTVAPLPSPIAPASVCIGQTTTLIGSGGGTWSTSGTAIASVGLTTGKVTGLTAGVATVVYILPTGCFASTPVTVNALPSAIVGASNLCQGQTTPFSDATPGGVWSSLNPGIASVGVSGDVFGNSYGSTSIVYTLSSTGCQASKSVTVNPVPLAITGVLDICVGQTLTTLTDATPGGTWSSSLAFIGTIDSLTGVFNGLSGGTTQIDYILGTGCMTSTLITVNLPPAPITGPDEVCVGYNTTLNDASPWGAWSSISPAIAAIDAVTGVVTGVTPGTTTISYTLMTTGCASSITFSVSPTPSAIAGNAFICLGSFNVFTDVIGGGTWYSTNPGIASVTGTGPYSATVTGMSLGPATIIYTLPAGCATFISVEVVPLPTVFSVTGGGSFCADDTGAHIYLSGSVKATNYLLYNGGKIATGPIAGSGGALDFGLQKVGGTYTVVATNTLTGCSNPMSGSAVIKPLPLVTPTASITSLTGDTVCNGVSTTFNGTITGGGSSPIYKWDVNGTVVGSGTTYTFIPANGDVVTFTLKSNETCPRPSATVSSSIKMNVVLPVTPSVSLSSYPGDTICQGLAITFTPVPAYGGTAPTYTWMRNGSLAGTGSTFTYVPVKGDYVYCRMTSNYMCLVTKTVASNTVAVTVDSAVIPVVTLKADPGTSVALGQSVTLTAVVTSAVNPTYQWFINGLPEAGATSSTFTTNKVSQHLGQADSVSCTVTGHGLCTITSHQWAYMSVHNVGVQQINTTGSEISVLPNPNKGEFIVKGTLGTINDAEVTLEITDLLGQVVYKNTVTAKGGAVNERIKLSNTLANGMYLLNVRSEAGNQVFHLVIEQ